MDKSRFAFNKLISKFLSKKNSTFTLPQETSPEYIYQKFRSIGITEFTEVEHPSYLAPPKRVFKIEVGNLPPEVIDIFVENLMHSFGGSGKHTPVFTMPNGLTFFGIQTLDLRDAFSHKKIG
jgi:hypothetical protein